MIFDERRKKQEERIEKKEGRNEERRNLLAFIVVNVLQNPPFIPDVHSIARFEVAKDTSLIKKRFFKQSFRISRKP